MISRKHLFNCLVAACLISSFIFAGCGGKETPETTAPETVTETPEVKAEETPTPTPTEEPTPIPDDSIHVDNVADFLEAIKPGAKITIEPGLYNLELDKIWEEQGEAWNEAHEYLELVDSFDGRELWIKNCDDLKISGGGDNFKETEIVVMPRYAAVMHFEKCKNVTVENMTMGHTDTGECTGNVIDLYGCKNVEINNMDIYGCGVYGLGLWNGCADITVNNSVIRDCYYGPFEFNKGKGALTFNECTLRDCGWLSYSPTSETKVVLNKCTLGDQETTSLDSMGNIIETNDCTFGEIQPYEYPEYDEGYDYDFDPSTLDLKKMTEVVFHENISDRWWTGYMKKNTATGEVTYLPFYDDEADVLIDGSCEFLGAGENEDDGRFWLYAGDLYLNGVWRSTSLWGVGMLKAAEDEEFYAYASLYKDSSDANSHLWLCVSIGDEEYWMY